MNKIAKDVKVIEKALASGEVVDKTASGDFPKHVGSVPLGCYAGNSKGVVYTENVQNGKTNTTEFGFNGIGDLSHETFALNVGENEWNFCKTARKPYDLAVCMILLSLYKGEYNMLDDMLK